MAAQPAARAAARSWATSRPFTVYLLSPPGATFWPSKSGIFPCPMF
jgi:hypothetical protein